MNTIELSLPVARKFLNTQYPQTNSTYIPFEEFAVLFPVSAFASEDLVNNMRKMMGSSIAESDINALYTVMVNFAEDHIEIKLIDNRLDLMIEAHINGSNERKYLKLLYNYEYSDSLLLNCLEIIKGTIYHLNSPTVIKDVAEIKEKRSGSVAKAVPSTSKKYIYRTRYRFKNIVDPSEQKETRNITRKTESWPVRGHLRQYRDKEGNVINETWVKSYNKGQGAVKEKEYKITKVD